jgi:ABC-type branched-subunit amino acid transport system substrate-binding protein
MINPSRTLILILFGAFIVPVLLAVCGVPGSLAQSLPNVSPAAAKLTAPLSAEERRGKAFYLRGESAGGQEITAMMGEIDVPASTIPCAGCHGMRGEGKTEGGVTAGGLTWSYLTKPYGHADGARKHPAFSEASLIRTLTAGLDPAGNKLAVAMPTYRMPREDMANLIAYLKRMELDTDPGVSENTIVVGTLLPEAGAMGGMGQSMEDVLRAYFAEVNSRGGVYNRKLELRVARGPAAATLANFKSLVDDEHVFAVVSGLVAGSDENVAALSREQEVPVIGPATLLPQRGLPLNRYVFYLLPGLKEQAQALVNFAAKQSARANARVAVVSAESDLNKQIAATIDEQGKKVDWQPATRLVYPREKFNATQSVAQLKQEGTETVFLLGSGADASDFFKAAEAANWSPSVYLLGALAGKEITEIVSVKMKDHVFLAFPTIQTDVSEAGAREFKGLLEKYKLSTAHAAAQLSALAAAKTFVQALERSGRNLTREQLVTTLEGLYEFETGLTPRLSFGPNRRVGALGAYVVTIDPEKKLFPATAEWINAE